MEPRGILKGVPSKLVAPIAKVTSITRILVRKENSTRLARRQSFTAVDEHMVEDTIIPVFWSLEGIRFALGDV